MQKDDLKSLITHIYENLLAKVDQQEDATKKQVVTYLRDAINTVENISDDNLNSSEDAKSAFDNAYEEVAKKSILSYQHTNKRFEKLTNLHKETLISCNETDLDLPLITKKFNDIQSYMIDEVEKANDTINQLSAQIKSLEKDSNLDSLTKIFNRRALSKYLIQACKNAKNDMHLLILDIDDFKAINDTFGHIAGDKILIFIASILKKIIRDADKVFRYGGEEFVIVLNRITQKRCETIALRILETIRQNRLIYKGKDINVTMSIGGTIFTKNDTPDSVIARADKALYRAKNNGKNQMQMELLNGI